MFTHIYYCFSQFFPETAVLVMITTVFLRLNYNWKVLGAIAVANSLIAYLIRMFSPMYGYHSIILILLLAVSFRVFCHTKIIDSFLATIKTFTILAILEILSGYLLIRYVGISIENVRVHSLYKTGLITINIILLFGVGLLIHFLRKYRRKKYQQKERTKSYVQKNY